MKTFDIAEKYLKDLDCSGFDIYNDPNEQIEGAKALGEKIKEAQKKFLADEDNTVSNEYYRSMTFAACFYHHLDLFHRKVSFWDVSCVIIESNIKILNSKYEGWTKGSIYPKIMMDEFVKYCNELNPQPLYLNEKEESRNEYFMAAFEYITADES